MDSLLAWHEWRALHGDESAATAGPTRIYPWSVFRFLLDTGTKQLEEYTKQDLEQFLSRSARTPFERRHYQRVVDSFFAWYRRHLSISASGTRSFRKRAVRSWVQRHGAAWRAFVAAVLTPELLPVPTVQRVDDPVTVRVPDPVRPRAAERRRRHLDDAQSPFESKSKLRSLLRLIGIVMSAVALEAAIAAWLVLRLS